MQLARGHGFDFFPRRKRGYNLNDEIVEVRKEREWLCGESLLILFRDLPLPSKFSCTSYLSYSSRYAIMPNNAVNVYMPLPFSLGYENQTIIDTKIILRLHDQ